MNQVIKYKSIIIISHSCEMYKNKWIQNINYKCLKPIKS